jgi:hypothetical protein
MFNQPTLFVLGAGASQEVGLPIGANLTGEIARRVDFYFDETGLGLRRGDPSLIHVLRQQGGDINRYVRAGRQISVGMRYANSIDDYLDAHKDDAEINLCGKLAIVRSILEAERESALYVDTRNRDAIYARPGEVDQSWFLRFFKILVIGVDKAHIDSLFNNVSVISFNYDRCLGYFLIRAITEYYAVSSAKAQEVVGRLNILFPYGSVGKLSDVVFGGENFQVDRLSSVASGIRTFTEERENAAALGHIHAVLRQASVVVFLGFGFHEQNMRLLTPPSPLPNQMTVQVPPSDSRVYASAFGVSGPNSMVHKARIISLVSGVHGGRYPEVEIANMKCAALLDEYRKWLDG